MLDEYLKKNQVQ